jgi:hypothetical protein
MNLLIQKIKRVSGTASATTGCGSSSTAVSTGTLHNRHHSEAG